ncbi:MAG: TolC family protein [Magnetococcales bacterium]|nr:TolC family protein [Magnetococcales bacterium]
MKPFQRVASTMLLLLTLTGCAVKPVPFSPEENQQRGDQDRKQLFGDLDPLTGPVDLPTALRRALRYNLETRVALAEQAAASGQFKADLWSLAPQANLSQSARTRSNQNSSVSHSVNAGTNSEDPTFSASRESVFGEFRMLYNLLDFGISWLNARQSGNQRFIAEERRRKAVQNLMRDVREAYWQAVAAERTRLRIDPLQEQLELARKSAMTAQETGVQKPLDALRFRLLLVDAMDQINQIRTQITAARIRLAYLIHLPPGVDFQVALPDVEKLELPRELRSLNTLESFAMVLRPELRELGYQKRISTDDIHKSWVRLFPGIELGSGFNWDSNPYLANQNWVESNIRLTWNVVNLFSGSSMINAAETKDKVVEMRRLAITTLVLSQIHGAYKELDAETHSWRSAQERSAIMTEIVAKTQALAPTEEGGQVQVIKSQIEAGVADLQRDMAYARLQSAYGRLLNAVGDDPDAQEPKPAK